MSNQTTNDNSQDVNSLIRYANINLNLFYLIFGNLGNLFKVAFFLQRPLRSLPCSFYILCATISDFVTLNNLPLRQLLIYLYPEYHSIKLIVDWSNFRNETILLTYPVSTYDIIMCKIRSYLHMLSTDLSSQMLVFASVNRYFFSYFRKNRQKKHFYISQLFSHYPNVHKLCLISVLIFAFISIHHIINFTILSPSKGCIPQNNILWTGWILSIHCFLLPLSMIIFGFLTLRNLRYSPIFSYCFYRRRRRRRRHQIAKDQFIEMCSYCIRCKNSIQHKIDTQLTSMILSEIIITVCTSLPYGSYAFYHLLYGTQFDKTYKTEWISLFIRMSMYLEASCGFYIYLITLTTLRKRFYKSFIEKITSINVCCLMK
jgi:hypothetical protein